MTNSGQHNWKKVGITAVILILAGGCIYLYSYANTLQKTLTATKDAAASSTLAYQEIVKADREKLTSLQAENISLASNLTAEQKTRIALEHAKATNEQQIDTLTKLTTIDPELLKKYSKVYFLSENYVPPVVTPINPAYRVDPTKELFILSQVAPFLDQLFAAANQDGVPLRATSAYRSFAEQKEIKTGYRLTYGAGTANQFSAEQGYSEHQLGTTLDFTTPTIKGAELTFEETTSFTWLKSNAYKYGFVLSYPKGNGYYQYEPWHWRFVGRELAKYLHDQGKNFYELDQRTLDGYLIKIFD
ncbi:MAG: M15 family metallopeptidase [Patescibacteria group bacterium]